MDDEKYGIDRELEWNAMNRNLSGNSGGGNYNSGGGVILEYMMDL